MKYSVSDIVSVFIHESDLFITNYVKNKLAPLNLAPMQSLIVLLLCEKDGLNQNELAEKLNKDKTNIARMVFNLKQKGLIERISDEHDRRSLRVYLTEKGKEIGKSVVLLTEEFNEMICKGISDEELMEVKRILSKMCANLQ